MGATRPSPCSAACGRSCARSGQSARTTRARPSSSSSARTPQIAKVIYEWLARGQAARPASRRRTSRASATRRPASTRSASTPRSCTRPTPARPKSDESAWMRLTLDTVGKIDWPRDRQGRPIYPEGFEELAEEARTAAAPARPRRALHRQRRHADRGLGLQHGHAHHRPAAVHVAAPVRAGGRPRPAAVELRGRRGRPAHRGGRQGLRRAVRGHPVQGEPQGAPRPPAPKRHHVHAVPAQGRASRSASRASRATARRSATA